MSSADVDTPKNDAKIDGPSKSIKKKKSLSKKSDLIMPVTRVRNMIKSGKYHTGNINSTSPVFLAGILEYMTKEIIECSALQRKMKQSNGKTGLLTRRHIMLAIKNDEDFKLLFENVEIAGAGVNPSIKSRKVSEFLKERKGQSINSSTKSNKSNNSNNTDSADSADSADSMDTTNDEVAENTSNEAKPKKNKSKAKSDTSDNSKNSDKPKKSKNSKKSDKAQDVLVDGDDNDNGDSDEFVD